MKFAYAITPEHRANQCNGALKRSVSRLCPYQIFDSCTLLPESISINGSLTQNGCFLSQPPPLQYAQEVIRWTSAHWQAHSPRHSFRFCLIYSKRVRRQRKKPARQSRDRVGNGPSHSGLN